MVTTVSWRRGNQTHPEVRQSRQGGSLILFNSANREGTVRYEACLGHHQVEEEYHLEAERRERGGHPSYPTTRQEQRIKINDGRSGRDVKFPSFLFRSISSELLGVN